MKSKFLSALIALSLLAIGPSVYAKDMIDFTLSSADGNTFTLSEVVKERPVLVVFFATWCPPCQHEVPELIKLQDKDQASGLKILAVDVDESKETAANFIRSKGINYTVLLDEGGRAANQYGVEGIPTNILIARGGEVKYEGHSIPENIDDILSNPAGN